MRTLRVKSPGCQAPAPLRQGRQLPHPEPTLTRHLRKQWAASLRVRRGDPEGTLSRLGRARTLGLCAHAAGGQARATRRPRSAAAC